LALASASSTSSAFFGSRSVDSLPAQCRPDSVELQRPRVRQLCRVLDQLLRMSQLERELDSAADQIEDPKFRREFAKGVAF